MGGISVDCRPGSFRSLTRRDEPGDRLSRSACRGLGFMYRSCRPGDPAPTRRGARSGNHERGAVLGKLSFRLRACFPKVTLGSMFASTENDLFFSPTLRDARVASFLPAGRIGDLAKLRLRLCIGAKSAIWMSFGGPKTRMGMAMASSGLNSDCSTSRASSSPNGSPGFDSVSSSWELIFSSELRDGSSSLDQ